MKSEEGSSMFITKTGMDTKTCFCFEGQLHQWD